METEERILVQRTLVGQTDNVLTIQPTKSQSAEMTIRGHSGDGYDGAMSRLLGEHCILEADSNPSDQSRSTHSVHGARLSPCWSMLIRANVYLLGPGLQVLHDFLH